MNSNPTNPALGGYSIFLTVFGTIFNSLTCFICSRKSLSQTPTFVFFAFLAIVDIVPLYLINLFYTNIYLNSFQLLSGSFFCAIFPSGHCMAVQSSSWLLVCMTVERCISVKMPMWRKTMFNSKRAIILCSAIVSFFILFNIPQMFNHRYGYIDMPIGINGNATVKFGKCIYSYLFYVYSEIHTYAYSIIPFSIIICANIVLIHSVVWDKQTTIKRSKADIAKRRALSVSVSFFSICFILFTAAKCHYCWIFSEN